MLGPKGGTAIENLGATDLRAVLDVVRELESLPDLAAYRVRTHLLVAHLVPADNVVYNEVDPVRPKVLWVTDPPEFASADAEVFARYLHQHPVAMHLRQTNDCGVRTISDFISHRQLVRLELYQEFFRYVETEYQATLQVPAPPPLLVGVSVNRISGDVTPRERALLELLQPHAGHAYQRLLDRARARQALAALENGSEAPRRTVVLLGRDGAIVLAGDTARRLLASYFAESVNGALPARLAAWVRAQRDRYGRADEPLVPLPPLVEDGPRGRLCLRFLPAGDDHPEDALLIEERPLGPDDETLRRLPLTRREREVLARVAGGQSNADIAGELLVSPLTVKKHLEHIYAKLEVSSRAAAVARAYDS